MTMHSPETKTRKSPRLRSMLRACVRALLRRPWAGLLAPSVSSNTTCQSQSTTKRWPVTPSAGRSTPWRTALDFTIGSPSDMKKTSRPLAMSLLYGRLHQRHSRGRTSTTWPPRSRRIRWTSPSRRRRSSCAASQQSSCAWPSAISRAMTSRLHRHPRPC